jgi:hypothetical protein
LELAPGSNRLTIYGYMGAKIKKKKISPPCNSPPQKNFKIPIVLLLDNFFNMLGSALQFYKKIRFLGKYRHFKVLGG